MLTSQAIPYRHIRAITYADLIIDRRSTALVWKSTSALAILCQLVVAKSIHLWISLLCVISNEYKAGSAAAVSHHYS